MATEYIIDKNRSLVMVTVIDTINFSEMVETINSYHKDENFFFGMNIIYDFRKGDVDISGDEIMHLVEFLQSRNSEKPYKLGLVLSEDGTFGFGRMFSVYSEELPSNLKIFREMPLCLQWRNFSED